jgi:hypothetical protein
MGRGRAKAKQTKVARQLKYSSGGTDLDRLQAELAGEHSLGPVGIDGAEEDADDDEDYAAYSYGDDEDDDEDSVGA